MTTYTFLRLGKKGPAYDDLIAAWKAECEALGEDFETYSAIPVAIFNEIMERDAAKTGLYVAQADDGSFGAVCMVNHARIPGYVGPVLRVRHILLSPRFDLGEWEISDYVEVIFAILNGVIERSEKDAKLKANHIKLHARSPSDMQFLQALGTALGKANVYASVQVKGTWLYITKEVRLREEYAGPARRVGIMDKNAQAALYAAIAQAIKTVGLGTFKKTSFFISSYAADAEGKRAA